MLSLGEAVSLFTERRAWTGSLTSTSLCREEAPKPGYGDPSKSCIVCVAAVVF